MKPKHSSHQPAFRNLRWRLLGSYLAVMTAIMATSITVMYHVVRYNLYQKVDRQLEILADAAAHNLAEIKSHPSSLYDPAPVVLDHDGDLDLPWQDLQTSDQAVEWFDATGRKVGAAGRELLDQPFFPSFQVTQEEEFRSLTIPVYSPTYQLEGYVRVSQSTEDIHEELERLLTGFGLGGLVALILSGIGGWGLTQQAFAPIEKSFHTLQQFTADASHELRSPLTAIRTSVEVMQSHPERIHPADQRKLQAIASATQQMTHLVEDLLLLARSDTIATRPAERVTLPLDELLEDLSDLFLPQAEAKQITFVPHPLPPVLVSGNASQLKRVFSNLLSNALHYTPSGGTITLSMHPFAQTVLVKIEDTGIGIAPDQLPLIFDRFWRADKARLYREGGLGLGLAIAQAITQDHGGKITVTSQLGQGSCFQVRLPTVMRTSITGF